MDAHANFERLNSTEGIRRVMDKAKAIGVTDVVIDVKPIDGYVMYASSLAPELLEWQGVRRSLDFLYVETMITEARKREMKAHLALNVFSEGNKMIRFGVAYEDQRLRDWAVVVYSPKGLQSILETEEEVAVFVNPALPQVQEYELNLIQEMAEKFKPDGIVLDRCRYTGMRTDFSDYSRKAFEEWLGRRVESWPYDIITVTIKTGGKTGYMRGQLFKEWIEWRASVIADFFRKARERVKKVAPMTLFGDYVGAWYPTYFEVGVNWASSTYDPSAEYDWATPTYGKTGYADLLDFLMVGTYFYEVSAEELKQTDITRSHRDEPAMKTTKEDWYSVEGSAQIAMKVTRGVTPVFGSLYVEQYKERDNQDQFARAVRMARDKTNGLMIFDVVHIDKYDWWDVLGKAVKR